MTAKERLLEYVSGLTEEEAIDKLPWILGPEPDFPPAPPEIVAMAKRALQESGSGARGYTTEEVRRYLGLK